MTYTTPAHQHTKTLAQQHKIATLLAVAAAADLDDANNGTINTLAWMYPKPRKARTQTIGFGVALATA